MDRETVDTNQGTPNGHWFFKVEGKPEKKKSSSGKSTYRIWRFVVCANRKFEGVTYQYSQVIFPWDSSEIFEACEFPEGSVQGTFDVDWDECDGKMIEAELSDEEDKNGKSWQKLKNMIAAEVPF